MHWGTSAFCLISTKMFEMVAYDNWAKIVFGLRLYRYVPALIIQFGKADLIKIIIGIGLLIYNVSTSLILINNCLIPN